MKEPHTRAQELRKALWAVTEIPDDKSLHQVREDLIIREFGQVSQESADNALKYGIYALGPTVDECIYAAALNDGWGAISDIAVLEGGDPKYTWGRRFYADGTSMKAAGWAIPGGFIMTWWK